MAPGGLIWNGPQCSSFVMLSPQRSDRDDRALMRWMNLTRFLVHIMRMRKTWHMLGEWLKQYTALNVAKTRSVQGSRG